MASSEKTFLIALERARHDLTKEQTKAYNLALNVVYELADESVDPEELTAALDSYFRMNPGSKRYQKFI